MFKLKKKFTKDQIDLFYSFIDDNSFESNQKYKNIRNQKILFFSILYFNVKTNKMFIGSKFSIDDYGPNDKYLKKINYNVSDCTKKEKNFLSYVTKMIELTKDIPTIGLSEITHLMDVYDIKNKGMLYTNEMLFSEAKYEIEKLKGLKKDIDERYFVIFEQCNTLAFFKTQEEQKKFELDSVMQAKFLKDIESSSYKFEYLKYNDIGGIEYEV